MFIEFSVLSGQKSLGEHLGHLIERNEETVFPVKRTDDAPVTRQNGGGECGTVIGDTGKPRQIPDSPKIDANHGCEAEGHEHADDGSKKKKHSLHEQGDTLFPPLRKAVSYTHLPKIIQEWLASMNMDMPADPVKCLFVPKHEGLSQCVALGKTVAEALKAKC